TAGRWKVAEDPLGGLAGADDDDVLDSGAADREELLAKDRDGRRADRGRAAGDAGARARLLADRERVVEESGQDRADPAGLARGVQRVAHLPEDLRLAEQLRLEPGRDREEVAR